MIKDKVTNLSIAQLAKLIEIGEISPVEVTKAHLNRIVELEPNVNSFISILYDKAMEQAQQAEEEITMKKYRGTLHGIPYSLKDLYYTTGIKTTLGSKINDSFKPTYSSKIGEELNQAGSILLGKNNMHPFAYGITGENPDYGHTHNPWDLKRISGGSSSGSASAVASGQCTFSMGTDTGGSVRIPAALCGIVGLKPTYGLLSRQGIAPLSWSQDHAGPLTRTVEDCALVMNSLTNNIPNSKKHIDYTSALNADIKGLRVGIPTEFFNLLIDEEVRDIVLKAIEKLEELGAIINEIHFPKLENAMAIANTIQMAEAASAYHEIIKEHGNDIFEPVRMRLDSGFFVSGPDYLQAQRARVSYMRDSAELMKDVDVLVTPTTPVTAFEIGTQQYEINGELRNIVGLMSQYTRPFNLNGFPAISIPCGYSATDLPIGMQFVGKPFDEKTILRVAYTYEQSVGWDKKIPEGL